MKKYLVGESVTIVLIVTFIISLLGIEYSFANEKNTDGIVNSTEIFYEYDAYVNMKKKTTNELLREGYSKEVIEAVSSGEIEKELLYLASLSNSELHELGYSNEQILILKNYQGEPIESNPELRGAFANMTCSKKKLSVNNSQLGIQFSWSWSNPPLRVGTTIKDAVAVRWEGTGSSGGDINVALVKDKSSCNIKYFTRDGASNPQTVTKTLTSKSAYSAAESSFPTARENNLYCKEGYINLYIEKTGTDAINEAAYYFVYGHPTVSAAPTISYPAGFSIVFNATTETMGSITCRLKRDGTIISY